MADRTEEPTAREERRGSLGRALQKMKAVVTRSTTRKATSTTPFKSTDEAPTKGTSSVPATSQAESTGQLQPPESTADKPGAATTSNTAKTTETDAPKRDAATVRLFLDTAQIIEVDEVDGPVLPLSVLPGFDVARARAIFEKYGIKYEVSSSPNEDEQDALGSKPRRVEKPIRIRIHWTCHECQATFATNKTCRNCLHRRCNECARSPAKKVKEVLQGTKQIKEVEKQVAQSNEQQDSVAVPATATQAAIIAEDSTGEDVETDGPTDGDANQTQYVMLQRPRAGMDVVFRSKAQVMRRTCPECQTHFISASRPECQNSGHEQCILWPRNPHGSPEDAYASALEQRMAPTVQRVYRKQRQRVRWSCDQCLTVFVDRLACRNCGHAKCESCIRSPAKRVQIPPTSAILQSVEDKLAHLRASSP